MKNLKNKIREFIKEVRDGVDSLIKSFKKPQLVPIPIKTNKGRRNEKY
jgi:hypothetical protein